MAHETNWTLYSPSASGVDVERVLPGWLDSLAKSGRSFESGEFVELRESTCGECVVAVAPHYVTESTVVLAFFSAAGAYTLVILERGFNQFSAQAQLVGGNCTAAVRMSLPLAPGSERELAQVAGHACSALRREGLLP